MSILVTGAAGFIGFHVCRALLVRGESVIGLDNLNDYYSVDLKKARLAALPENGQFTFHAVDFADNDALTHVIDPSSLTAIVHLGAQAGVRYSIDHPHVYGQSNLVGYLNMLELARHAPNLKHMVYGSSSSVYGGNTKLPFSETDPVDNPVSLYAATKRANELMSSSYAHLYGIPLTGLRFFTVYGPWGRPDMAVWLFTEAVFNRKPLRLFKNGDLYRDFTFIDDIVSGVLAVLNGPPNGPLPHKVYNIGNNKPEKVTRLIEILEAETGLKAEIFVEPLQPGDVEKTAADIDAINSAFGFEPSTSLDVGLPIFIDWYRQYRGL
ncbi:MAG: NAD-dependent epimerase/dehydratase family protein [Proteobacteria bacterium]|nr:NAD-dependent epimerase/dehydratase family protein [Pseudomonadota bacterium]